MEWIPVEKRLPEITKFGCSKVVWVTDAWGRTGFAIYHKEGKLFHGEGSWFIGGGAGENDVKIIAWMPVPEPYQPIKKQEEILWKSTLT